MARRVPRCCASWQSATSVFLDWLQAVVASGSANSLQLCSGKPASLFPFSRVTGTLPKGLQCGFIALSCVFLLAAAACSSRNQSAAVQGPPEPEAEATAELIPTEPETSAQPAADPKPVAAVRPMIVAPPAPPAPTANRPRESGTVGGVLGAFVSSQPRERSQEFRPGWIPAQGRDRFTDFPESPVSVVAENSVSTFSIDVDTASYSFVRASLEQGVLPPKNAVRVEELINYFPYDYPIPEDRGSPFSVTASLMQTPWNTGTRLLHIGIRGYEQDTEGLSPANLVFLIDTSGSMRAPNKLPLLVNSFKLLLDSLAPDDTVAIVTYAGSAGVALEPTPAVERGTILATLERLRAGGSTAGAEGIRQAYLLAEQNLTEDGVNRVILATDGDFNVGITDTEELKSFVERKRERGVYLSVLGFGRGNYNDALMQALAQNGNGHAAYIDNLMEARKVLVEEATSTLFPIAKDVKIQIEFNPDLVQEYRLIGYESRMLAREDFRNDNVDAGEIGSGHTVTAIYELTPTGADAALVGSLRYQRETASPGSAFSDEYAFLKIRFKAPDGDTSDVITEPITRGNEIGETGTVAREARFSVAVAGFGQLLRGGRYTGDLDQDDVIDLAMNAKGDDPFGYRAEFINLVRLAKSAAAMEPLRRE